MDISSPFLRRSLIAPEMMLGIVRRSSCDTGPPLIVSSSITVVPFRCASIMIVDITFVAYFGNHMLPATETASDQLTGPVIIVRDRTTREPATAETNLLCSRLKDAHRILTSIDGPHDNVLVIKPPMCFGIPEAKTLVEALRTELRGLDGVDVSKITHTPT